MDGDSVMLSERVRVRLRGFLMGLDLVSEETVLTHPNNC